MADEQQDKLTASAAALCALGDALQRTYDVRIQKEPENPAQWEKWRTAMDGLEARMEELDGINRRLGELMPGEKPELGAGAQEELESILSDAEAYHARYGGMTNLLRELKPAVQQSRSRGADDSNTGGKD